MKFDIYGRFQVEVLRKDGAWEVYRLARGTRSRAVDLVIPPELPSQEIGKYLDDLFHEAAQPGSSVRIIE